MSVRPPDDVPSAPFQLSRVLLATIAVGAVAAASMVFAARPADPAPVIAREPAAPPPLMAAVVEDSAKQRADALAESLQKLERAELERRELERKLEERAQAERAAAEAIRKREEHARDQARHETVKKELDALSLASARRNVAITMYSTSWCGSCVKARNYMQSRNIAFTELDVDRDAAAKARARALNPRGSVPTIAIDQEVMVGFSPESLESRITRAAKRRTGS